MHKRRSSMSRLPARHSAVRGLVALAVTALVAYFLTRCLLCTKSSLLRGDVTVVPGDDAKKSCPVPVVDWSGYQDPGPAGGGSAAVLAMNVEDPAVFWFVRALQKLKYQVTVLVPESNVVQATAFFSSILTKLPQPNEPVTVKPASWRNMVLDYSHVRLFVHVCGPEGPVVLGRGTANILVTSLQQTNIFQPKAEQSQALSDMLVSTYDYLLFRSVGEYVHYVPGLEPCLMRLQAAGKLFPLLDVMSFPALPNLAPATPASAVPAIAVALSASKYDTSMRSVLSAAMQQFQELRKGFQGKARLSLIVRPFLMQGIEKDVPYLQDLAKRLDMTDAVDYRDAASGDAVWGSVAVQWHLYNQDTKPHYSATAGMPQGVWVADCTGSMKNAKGLVFGTSTGPHTLAMLTSDYLQRGNPTNLKSMIQQASLPVVDQWFGAKVFQVVHRAYRNKIFRYFVQQTTPAYMARVTPAPSPATPPPRAAVIVEARPHFAFLYVVLNAAYYLPGWSLHVVHSRANANFVQTLLKPYVNAQYYLLDADNVDIDDYNHLMKNSSFWQWFQSDHVLIYQTDSLMLRRGLDRFLPYDYIGAPWHQENERWSQPALRAALPGGVGNGGFSLRSVRAMTAICDKLSATSPLKEQEDVFFAVNVEKDPDFHLAGRKDAYEFAQEVPCVDMPKVDPVAVHAAWYYMGMDDIQHLLDSSLFALRDCPDHGSIAANLPGIHRKNSKGSRRMYSRTETA